MGSVHPPEEGRRVQREEPAHLLRDLLEILHALEQLHRDRTLRRDLENLRASPLHDVGVLPDGHRRERQRGEVAALAREDEVTDVAAEVLDGHIGLARGLDHPRHDVVVLPRPDGARSHRRRASIQAVAARDRLAVRRARERNRERHEGFAHVGEDGGPARPRAPRSCRPCTARRSAGPRTAADPAGTFAVDPASSHGSIVRSSRAASSAGTPRWRSGIRRPHHDRLARVMLDPVDQRERVQEHLLGRDRVGIASDDPGIGREGVEGLVAREDDEVCCRTAAS